MLWVADLVSAINCLPGGAVLTAKLFTLARLCGDVAISTSRPYEKEPCAKLKRYGGMTRWICNRAYSVLGSFTTGIGAKAAWFLPSVDHLGRIGRLNAI